MIPRIYQTTVKEFIKPMKRAKFVKAVLVKLKSRKGREDRTYDAWFRWKAARRTVKADLVLIAAGFLGAQKYVTDAFKVELNARTNVKTKPGKFADQRAEGLYGRRYAQRPVSGGMGDPRRPGSGKSSG